MTNHCFWLIPIIALVGWLISKAFRKKPKITETTNSSYEDWKHRFPDDTQPVLETPIKDNITLTERKPPKPKPKAKSIQEQIDEAYERARQNEEDRYKTTDKSEGGY